MKRPKTREQWREEVREKLSLAPVRTKTVAEDLGIKPTRLYTFISAGHLHPREVQKVEDYLKQHGYVNEDRAPYAQFVTCKHCQRQTPIRTGDEVLLHCGHCGQPLGAPCANCHTPNDDDARFCKACGQPITRNNTQATAKPRAKRTA